MKIIVIGAGLSGAAMAGALARRGVQVTVLDAAPSAATSASSIPAGLMAPHVSKDNNLTSQLIRLGIAYTLSEVQRLLREGIDWQVCGAHYTSLKASPAEKLYPLWQANATWIKPAALVHAWLAQPGITFIGNSKVQRIVHHRPDASSAAHWQVFDASGRCLAQASHIVIATASASVQFAPLELHPVAGQVIYGAWTSAWQQTSPQRGGLHHAVNGNGHFIPAVTGDANNANVTLPSAFWLSGSTYEHDALETDISPQSMQVNCDRLAQLLPACAALLHTEAQSNRLSTWVGTRCTTRDRMPAVGEVRLPDQTNLIKNLGLYTLTGMGSRGLSFAALCADYLAGQIMGEPSSLPSALQKAIHPARLQKVLWQNLPKRTS